MPLQDLAASELHSVFDLWRALGYATGKAAFIVGFITSAIIVKVTDASASFTSKLLIVLVILVTGLAFCGLIARWEGVVPVDLTY